MSVLGLDFQAALQWITSRYEVPAMPKGAHIHHKERWPEQSRVGASGSALEGLIRSGIWASLTPSQRSLIPVLEMFADTDRKITISYRGMMRFAGLGSQSTVATALKRFRTLRFLRVEARGNSDGLRACNTYQLCFDDADFIQLANACHRTQNLQITQEREFRKRERRKRAAQLLPVNTLSNG